MAEHDENSLGGGEIAKHGDGAAKPAIDPAQLPIIESPSISPALSAAPGDDAAIVPKHEPEVEAGKADAMSDPNEPHRNIEPNFSLVPVAPPAAAAEPESATVAAAAPFFSFRSRTKAYARMAAAVAIGAVLGAIGGTLITGALTPSRTQSAAVVEENKAMQQSLTRLAKDVSALKTQVASEKIANDKIAANLVATGAAKSPARIQQETSDITGSISAPQTVVAKTVSVAAPAPAPVIAAPAVTPAVADVPVPRPAPRLAMAELQPARPAVVRDWTIRDARGGYIYVESHGDVYQIVPGAPLPGLGPVQSIKRLEGRWVVTTPKGIIVSMRDRRFFE